jgi:hypothetical protein
MKVLKQLAEVRLAQARMERARHEVGEPAAVLLARGREYPLATVGVAAGAGFALGSLDLHPLRVPGLASLVGGGLVEVLAQGSHLLAEMAVAGVAAHAAATADAAAPEGAPTP